VIHPRPALAVVLLGLSLSAACLPGAIPPAVPARSALALGGAAPAQPGAAAGPLSVAFATPRGETTQDTEIGVVFSKPMRALGLGPSDPAPPVSMRPAAKGAFHWVGSTALRFDAEAKLAPATTYHLEIPAGTRALDGSTLAEPFTFDFTTPRVAVVTIEPEEGMTDLFPDRTITLGFSMPVTDEEILRTVTLRAERAKQAIPYEIQRRNDRFVELVPTKPLPLADRIHIRVDGSLRPEGGDVPAGKDREVTFTTLGPPSVSSWSCTPHPDDASLCDPDASTVTLKLTSGLPLAALARAIVIEPKVDWDRSEVTSDQEWGELDIIAAWKPGTTYRVRVAPSAKLVDSWGQHIAGDGARTLRFGHRAARVRFGVRGTYWSARAQHTLGAWVTNASAAEVRATPRSLDDVLAVIGGAPPPPANGPAIALAEGSLDVATSTAVRLDELLPGARGPVDLLATYRPRDRAEQRTATHALQLTGLGITARVGHGGAAFFVSDIDDAKPAAGTTVEIYRAPRAGAPAKRLGTATVGAAGDAAISFTDPLAPEDRLAVVARRGSDWTYRTIDTPHPVEVVGEVFSERGLYRPGESVKLTGIVRVPGPATLTTPGSGPVHVTFKGPDAETIAPIDTTLSPFGTFSIDVPLPRSLHVGRYSVEAEAAGGKVRGRFNVAEYRPTQIAVEASTDRAEYTRGDTLRCRVGGRYLHGGAMAGATATVVVSRQPTSFDVPGLQGYTTHDYEASGSGGQITRARQKLDRAGTFTLPVALALPGQTSAEAVSCAVEAMDLNRQALSAGASATVHPGEIYVAVEDPRGTTYHPGDTVSIGVLAVTPAGDRRKAKVHVEVVRRDHWDTGVTAEITKCEVTTGVQPGTCSFTVPKDTPESMFVVRASTADARGNLVRASNVLRIELPPKPAPPSPPVAPSPRLPEPRYLRVSVEREMKVGQTGHIQISSPYTEPSTALVTIEREGILWQKVVPVPGDAATVDFPVTEAMIPSGHVHVALLSGKRVEREDAAFEVDASSKALAVEVDAGTAERKPGEAIDVEVRVKDAAGKPARAEVTLWAADEGTLSLLGYVLPDPNPVLHAWRTALTTGADSRDDLARLGLWSTRRAHPPQVRMGATMSSPPRGDFRQTAFFAAHLVTDDAGRVRRRFTLPDGLTTYRVMAVAVAADDRSGAGKTQVTTSLPLMARATLPRVVRAGDRFEASVVVSGEKAEGDAEVTAKVEGLTLASPARQTVRLASGEPAEIRFALRADRPGPARFTVNAALGKATDAMTLATEVVTPLVPESASIDGETSAAAAEALGDLGSIRTDYGGLEIALSTTPLSGLADGIEQLVEYPYGCTEQTVSRLVPLLALGDLASALGASLPADTQRAVTESIARLASHQRRDGGFGLWRESSKSSPWLTAWAAWGLGEARRRGAAVPPDVEDRARAYLREAAAVTPEATADRLAVAAFVADLAALDGKLDAALAGRLFERREQLPPFSRALLLHALVLGKGDRAQIAELSRDLESTVRLDGGAARVVAQRYPGVPFDTDTRTTAMLLRALVAVDPAGPLVPRLARALLESRRGGRFRTTHEAAWALLALDDLRRARPPSDGGVEARVFLGDALLREATLRGAKPVAFTVPAASLLAAAGRPLTFSASGPLQYHARLRFARRDLPTDSIESGFFLRRTTRPLDPDGPEHPAGTFTAGESVLVELDVVTPSPRNAVVLESPLPGGFEPADADLRLGGAWVAQAEKTWPATRRELRDDRVIYFVDDLPAGLTTFRFVARASTPGTFVTPPARIEEMYAPDTFARTPTESVVVIAP
jgi:hypothetical protein